MALPDYETMMRPFLEAIDLGASNVAEAVPHLKKVFAITDEEAEEMLPSGKMSTLASRAHWARTYLGAAGCLTSPKRNLHVITPRGKEMLKSHPTRIDNATLSVFPEFVAWRKKSAVTDGIAQISPTDASIPIAAQTPEDQISSAFGELEHVLATELLEAVLTVSPKQFEQLIVDLLLAMGYGGGDRGMGERIGKSGDGGIDGIINEDALGLDAVYVQAKRYAIDSKVGRPALQAFVGSLTGESATKGVFVTTSDFSKEARDYVTRVQHRIVLINGARLARLMIQHEVGVRARKIYTLRSIDEDYFAEI